MDIFPEGLDLEALLAPIDGATRVGVDLRRNASSQSLYYKLRDARSEARAVERDMETRRSEDSPAPWPPPQWRIVRELAIEALGQTKDLEVAAWLAEALVRSHGLPGLTVGVKLMAGLVEGFWDELYPQPDEEGIATRVAPIAGLNGLSGNGTLILPLRRLTLCHRRDGAALELWQYEQSEMVASVVDAAARQRRLDAGAIPFETLNLEAVAAGGAHFAKLREAARAAGEAWRHLGAALDARAGADAPPTSAVRDLLDKVTAVAGRFAADEAPPLAATALAAGDPTPTPTQVGAITTREDALRALLDIAEYFRRTEPLSPLAYTLQEAVRRARMSWPQLLEEIVPDPGTRFAILTSLGIRPLDE